MDPLSITTATVSLVGAIAKASIAILKFIAELQSAAEEGQMLQRELQSFSGPLTSLKAAVQRLPDALAASLPGLLRECELIVVDIHHDLHAAMTGRARAMRWVVNGRDALKRRCKHLKAYQISLIMAVETSTWGTSMHVKDDTELILSKLDALRRDFPAKELPTMLERYLADTTSYAASVYEESVFGSEALADGAQPLSRNIKTTPETTQTASGDQSISDTLSAVVFSSFSRSDDGGGSDHYLSIRHGEVLTNITVVDGDWWKGRNGRGEVGLFSPSDVRVIDGTGSDTSTSSSTVRAKVLHNFNGAEKGDIVLRRGEIVTQIDKVSEFWWWGRNPRGKAGLFPYNYVEMLPSD